MFLESLRAPKAAVIGAHLFGAAAAAFVAFWGFWYGLPHVGWFWVAQALVYLSVLYLRLLRNLI